MNKLVQSQAEVIALQPGTLLRDSEGNAYRAVPWRPEYLRKELGFLIVMETEGDRSAIAANQIPFPLFILWEPDA